MSAEHTPAPSTPPAPTVVVCGSLNVDTFVRVDRFPTAGETTIASPNGTALGGKGANQAVAAARYLEGTDGTAVFQATVGADADGDTALSTLTSYGVDVSAVARAPQDVPTGQAFIMNDPDGENIIVVTSGANEHTDPAAQDSPLSTTAADVLLAQGELTPEHSAALPQLAEQLGARFVLNLAPVTTRDPALLAAADPLILNESEAAEVFDTTPDKAAVTDAAVAAVDAGLARSVLVTLGADGAVLVTGDGRTDRADRTDIAPLPADSVVDTTGAGDAFCGTLAAALAEGEDLVAAARLASAAGSLAVGGKGAAPSYAGRNEVRALL